MSVCGVNEKLTEGHRKERLPRKSLRSAEGLDKLLFAQDGLRLDDLRLWDRYICEVPG